jgi:hypothetical protein
VYVGQNNVADAAWLAPLVRHALYQSKKLASYVGDPGFYADANVLLGAGLFDMRLARPASEMCSQPGYAIREEASACDDPQNCKATVSIGIVARLKKDGQVVKTVSSGLRSEFSGFPALNKNAFYGYRELENGLSMQADLINKLNSN